MIPLLYKANYYDERFGRLMSVKESNLKRNKIKFEERDTILMGLISVKTS